MAEYVPIADIHIGEVIRQWMHGKMTRRQMADKLHLPKSNIDRILSSKSMETDKLLRICLLTGKDFFSIYGGNIDIESANPKVLPIGEEIRGWLELNNIPQIQLANALGVTNPVVSKMLKKEFIDTDRLVQVSNILKHNFFTNITAQDAKPIFNHENYKIQDEGIWVTKSMLEHLRDYYIDKVHDVASRMLSAYYSGRADACIDLLKMFEPLEGKKI